MEKLRTSERFGPLDGLRAIAILLVVVAHSGLDNFVPGGLGVTIFFTISGFIISSILIREFQTSRKFNVYRFYWNRAWKIVPPFALLVFLPGLVFVTFFSGNLLHLFAQVLFMFNWVYMNGDANVFPGTGVVWSLSIEEQFYVAFSLAWYFFTRRGNATRLLFLLSSSFYLISNILRPILLALGADHNRIYYGSDTRISSIAAGILIALWVHAKKNDRSAMTELSKGTTNTVWLLVAILYLASLLIRNEFFRESLRYSLQELATALLIGLLYLGADSRFTYFVKKVLGSRAFRQVGLASYSTYLVHFTVILAWEKFAPYPDNVWVKSAIFTATSLSIGAAVYRAIEIPALRLRNKHYVSASK